MRINILKMECIPKKLLELIKTEMYSGTKFYDGPEGEGTTLEDMITDGNFHDASHYLAIRLKDTTDEVYMYLQGEVVTEGERLTKYIRNHLEELCSKYDINAEDEYSFIRTAWNNRAIVPFNIYNPDDYNNLTYSIEELLKKMAG